jgi:copper(I)-binding protein
MNKLLFIILFFLSTMNVLAVNPQIKPLAQSKHKQIENPIKIIEPWIRESKAARNSAAYFVIKNDSDKDVALLSASAMDIAQNVELHKSFVDEKGISRMVHIDKMVIPAHSEIVLKPAGSHIMFFGLKRSLILGNSVKLTLKFDNNNEMNIDLIVRKGN